MTTVQACADWTVVAPQWDAHRDHVEALKATLTDELIAVLGLSAGDRVLELGGGTGEVAARLAEAVRPGGRVIASDLAPGMVELIRARVGELPDVEVAQIDARDIPLADGSVDAVVFRMGLMLMPEPAVALAECLRVLAPGGRLAIAVWGDPQHNPWLTSVGMAAMMHGLVPGGPPIGPGGPFSLGDADALGRLITDAGFGGVEVRTFDTVAAFADADAHFDTVRYLAAPLATALAAASDEARAAVRATVAGVLEQYHVAGALRIPVRTVLAVAHR